jgi:uncharacterized protein (TIGR02147 family)
MEAIQVFNYLNPRQFLLDAVNALQKKNALNSIRQIAMSMGISHTLLVMLLQGKRPIKIKHGMSFAKGFGLSSQERQYLQALIQFDLAQEPEEKQLCQLWLSELHPQKNIKTKVVEEFEMISNWIHMAILSISELKDFDSAPEVIARRLGARVTVNEVRAAIERLETLKLIEQTADGKFKSTYHRVTTADDVASAGARRYHKEVMGLAQKALDEVPLSKREFQSFSISIPHDKVSLAKEMIRKFRSQFAKAMGDEPGDEVYQFNLQFFQLTESPVRIGRTEDEGVDHNNKDKKEILL